MPLQGSRVIRLFLWIEQRKDEAQPPLGAAVGRFDVVADATLVAHQLAADLADLAVAEVDRHGPLLALPVVGRFEVDGDRPPFSQPLCQERLQECAADVGAIVIAGK